MVILNKNNICIHDEFCGGCIYNGMSYEEQLKEKEKLILESLEKHNVKVENYLGIVGSEDGIRYRYRNKMEYTFGDLVKDGPMTLGMHKIKHFMSIITVDECRLVHEDFNKILRFTLDFANDKGYRHYHKKSHKGLLRNLIIRQGIRTGELLINIVTTSESGFDEKSFIEGLLSLGTENRIVGILRTYNDSLADAVIPEKIEPLYGQDYYTEVINDLKFKVSPFSFFQTNVVAAERMYNEAIGLIEGIEDKRVFDLYCGTGTISQIAAQRAAHVTGVEIVEEAVSAAKDNAKANGLENCNFIAGDVFEVLGSIEEKPDVIVVDPPRVGMSVKAVEKIASYGVEQIVYISCNPKTLAINLEQFQQLGYKAESLKAYENYSWTKHVECIVLLSRK